MHKTHAMFAVLAVLVAAGDGAVYPRVEVDGAVYKGVAQSFVFAEIGT